MQWSGRVNIDERLASNSEGSQFSRFRSIASFQDRFRRNNDPQAVVAFPPIPAGIVESRSGFPKRAVALLQAYVKVFRADAQNDPAFVVK